MLRDEDSVCILLSLSLCDAMCVFQERHSKKCIICKYEIGRKGVPRWFRAHSHLKHVSDLLVKRRLKVVLHQLRCHARCEVSRLYAMRTSCQNVIQRIEVAYLGDDYFMLCMSSKS